MAIFLAVVFFDPYLFFPKDAFIPANAFVTPAHIKPEWYFLANYQTLKIFPNAQFQNIFSRLAQKYQIGLLHFFLEGVTAEQFQADNLYPTAAAQPLIMNNVLQALKPLLR